MSTSNKMKFNCESCNYSTNSKVTYEKHLLTKKHNDKVKEADKVVMVTETVKGVDNNYLEKENALLKEEIVKLKAEITQKDDIITMMKKIDLCLSNRDIDTGENIYKKEAERLMVELEDLKDVLIDKDELIESMKLGLQNLWGFMRSEHEKNNPIR